MDGEAFFSRGGRGGARPKIYWAGRGGEPPPPHSSGRGGEGPGRGTYCVYWLKSYAAAKEISICIALSEFNSLSSTKDDILDMEELFYMLTNFREQSFMPS